MATHTDLRQDLNKLINECLAELRKDRNQLEENLSEIERCLDQNNEWHAMSTNDGRICAGKLREKSLCIIDPQREQEEQITQIDITPDFIPISPKKPKHLKTHQIGFKEIVEKYRYIFEKR